MKKSLFLLIVFSIFLNSCEKINIPFGYPTSYGKISSPTLSEKQKNYINRNPYLETTLNDFGFCDIEGELLDRTVPPFAGSISEVQALVRVNDFVLKNASETGINNPQQLTFRSKTNQTSHDGYDLWHFRSMNQKIDTVEVLYSEILFHLVNGEVRSCHGNWYPEVYIPAEFNFNESKAKNVLIGRVVSHYSIGGEEYKFTISKKNLENCTFHLKVLPKEYEDRIDLYVCWQIYVPDVNYKLYVDVMSGDIVDQEPTVIS